MDLSTLTIGHWIGIAGIGVAVLFGIIHFFVPFIVSKRERRHATEAERKKVLTRPIDQQTNQNWPLIDNLPAAQREIIGRDDEITALAELVEDDHIAAVVGNRQRFAVAKGPGGIGKTELASEYARRNKKRYEGVWVVPAESEATMLPELKRLAQQLGVPKSERDKDTAKDAIKAAGKRGKPWLILFDNAPNPAGIADYLTTSETLHCLITSRHGDWGASVAIFDVNVLGEEQAAALLAQESGREDDFGPILEALGGYPLAIVAAGAYLRQRPHMDAAGYLAEFEKRLKDEVEDGSYSPMMAEDVPRSIWGSVGLSISALKPQERNLLSLAAYLSPDDLWPEMIGNPDADHEQNKGACEWPEFLADVRRNPALLQDAIGGLRQASLLREEGERLTLHRLTLAVMRAKLLDKENSENWADAAARLVNAYVPNDFAQPSEWDRYARLMPHIEALLPHAPASAASNRAFAQGGGYLHTRGDYPAAIRFHNRSVEISKDVNGNDNPLHATNLNSLAEALKLNGDWVEAELLYKQAIKIDERALGDHPQTATHINNLAGLYVSQKRFADAEPELLRAAEIDKTALGEDHPDYAFDLGNLGALYDRWAAHIGGDATMQKKAAEFPLQALKITRHAHGPLHQSTATAHNNLAVLHARQNDLPNAHEEMLRAIAIILELLGMDHPNTQKSLQSYANMGGTLDEEALAKETDAVRAEHAQWAVEKLQEIAVRHGVEATDLKAIAEAVNTESDRLEAEGAPLEKWHWPVTEFRGAAYGIQQAQKWMTGS